VTPPSSSLRQRVVIRAAEILLHNVILGGVSRAGRVIARRHLENVDYVGDGSPDHTLDIYRPKGATGLLPIVFYVHGGGFRILSKDTHWAFALKFADMGFTVFNINYRLSRTACFPAGLTDVFTAYEWVVQHAREHGGDPTRIVVAGESAGANLALDVALASCYRRDEPHARRLFDLGAVPRAVIPMCGHLQVTDPLRERHGKVPTGIVADRMHVIATDYLGPHAHDCYDLIDPIKFVELGKKPDRPLPPFLLSAGTRDPILDDTQRLETALTRLGVEHEAHYYPGEMHAFQALIFRKAAKAYWATTRRWLQAQVS
jgi:acetyl esterase